MLSAYMLMIAVGVTCPAQRRSAAFGGVVSQGERYERSFGSGLTFLLRPGDVGWTIAVRDERPSENISRLTPPYHFVPNPREIEGWHFRNQDNTGPNDGSVNAPAEVRDFLFSREVGRSINPPFREQDVTRPDLGHGRLTITRLVLSDVARGGKASIKKMWFSVELCWPRSWPEGRR